MKVIVAGSRHFSDKAFIREVLDDSPFPITELVCGMARGVDSIARDWAIDNDIPVKEFPAAWELYGKRAGGMRNLEMAKYGDAAIVMMLDSSKGSASMIKIGLQKNLQMFILNINSLMEYTPMEEL